MRLNESVKAATLPLYQVVFVVNWSPYVWKYLILYLKWCKWFCLNYFTKFVLIFFHSRADETHFPPCFRTEIASKANVLSCNFNGSDQDLRFLLYPCSTSALSLMKICLVVFVWSCWHTNITDMKSEKLNFSLYRQIFYLTKSSLFNL